VLHFNNIALHSPLVTYPSYLARMTPEDTNHLDYLQLYTAYFYVQYSKLMLMLMLPFRFGLLLVSL